MGRRAPQNPLVVITTKIRGLPDDPVEACRMIFSFFSFVRRDVYLVDVGPVLCMPMLMDRHPPYEHDAMGHDKIDSSNLSEESTGSEHLQLPILATAAFTSKTGTYSAPTGYFWEAFPKAFFEINSQTKHFLESVFCTNQLCLVQ